MAEGLGATWILLLAAGAGYLIGSVPFGLILTRLAGLGDVRRIGSGNIGATNVLRTGRKGLAAATLLLDGGKGAAAVLLLNHLAGSDGHAAGLSAGLFAVVGHNFPVWLGFRGGKGVATTLGVLLAAAWPVGLIACATWLAVAAVFRYSSLAALVALAVSPLAMAALADAPAAAVAAILALLGFWQHRANIRRLVLGEEPKIGNR
ncbi:MAG: glycerol-3-phosphate 1-O-acyltransferase [Rhodospirillales bacterium]|nr:MAG: glycerol-3-phosphate 1-O-acyltransferase [Rhodospirillales bacterium]